MGLADVVGAGGVDNFGWWQTGGWRGPRLGGFRGYRAVLAVRSEFSLLRWQASGLASDGLASALASAAASSLAFSGVTGTTMMPLAWS